ncbi:hypothetical protein [Saccharibacter floricola]|uniref:Lipoprotein n=1 Tax=Saccharibacter floricola DSM 15669 TaxID=1123227 RepID=A0ABQ0NZJ2_9PROT|nr:hypothetical protein [Saccharibacter floricola]GBQ07414.1 hypothetical protein AA15669_1371 [Saccharibacter floricola DSM 15669]
MKRFHLLSPRFAQSIKTLSTTALCAAGLSLSLAVTGCSGDQPEETFPTPSYSYLPIFHLNVGQIDISNRVTFDKHDIAAQSPTSPVTNLERMAQDRLKTTGVTGNAHFTVLKADITKTHGWRQLSGTFSVQLTLDDPAQQHHGQIIATVHQSRSFSSKTSHQNNLYTLNQALMDDMNVELEYQLRKHCSEWLTDATGTPLNAKVQSQDLDASQTGSVSGSTLTPPSSPNNALPAPGKAAAQSLPAHTSHAGELHLPQR